MANNRMFLVYRPTGHAVYLGKRMGWGWYDVPEDVRDKIINLFNIVEEFAMGKFSQDDFAVALESGENQPHVIEYKEIEVDSRGIKLVIDEKVPYGKLGKI